MIASISVAIAAHLTLERPLTKALQRRIAATPTFHNKLQLQEVIAEEGDAYRSRLLAGLRVVKTNYRVRRILANDHSADGGQD
jgi:hypothetical protein